MSGRSPFDDVSLLVIDGNNLLHRTAGGPGPIGGAGPHPATACRAAGRRRRLARPRRHGGPRRPASANTSARSRSLMPAVGRPTTPSSRSSSIAATGSGRGPSWSPTTVPWPNASSASGLSIGGSPGCRTCWSSHPVARAARRPVRPRPARRSAVLASGHLDRRRLAPSRTRAALTSRPSASPGRLGAAPPRSVATRCAAAVEAQVRCARERDPGRPRELLRRAARADLVLHPARLERRHPAHAAGGRRPLSSSVRSSPCSSCTGSTNGCTCRASMCARPRSYRCRCHATRPDSRSSLRRCPYCSFDGLLYPGPRDALHANAARSSACAARSTTRCAVRRNRPAPPAAPDTSLVRLSTAIAVQRRSGPPAGGAAVA